MREENPGDVQQNEDIQLQLTKATCHWSICIQINIDFDLVPLTTHHYDKDSRALKYPIGGQHAEALSTVGVVHWAVVYVGNHPQHHQGNRNHYEGQTGFMLMHASDKFQRLLTPPRDVKFGLVLRSSRIGDGGHVVKHYALDEHPQKHGCFAILDQGVEGVTYKRL